MATPTTKAPPRPTPQVLQVAWAGKRHDIVQQLLNYDFPPIYGPPAAVRGFLIDNIPAGDNWRGKVTVSSYRTPVNPEGSGTVYLSVRWEPER